MKTLCARHGVTRAGYYFWRHREPSAQASTTSVISRGTHGRSARTGPMQIRVTRAAPRSESRQYRFWPLAVLDCSRLSR